MGFMERRWLRYALLPLLMLCIGLAPAEGTGAAQKRHIVLIDPAHGGGDTGVVADRLREKDLTMNLALLIRQEALKTGNIEVRLTRNADTALSISDRAKAAGALQADCLLSLHVNAGFGKKASGYELYFPGFLANAAGGGETAAILKDMAKTKHLNDSVNLAQQIQTALEKVFPRRGRGLREAPNALLEAVTVPGLVVEIGFATQAEDRKQLTDTETQRAIARALMKGLQDYFSRAL